MNILAQHHQMCIISNTIPHKNNRCKEQIILKSNIKRKSSKNYLRKNNNLLKQMSKFWN